jgi:alpha-ketoglutarate-dependent taurine dioxygenase
VTDWTPAPIEPFGLVVTASEPGGDARSIPAAVLHAWAAEHRVVVLRGFAALESEAFPAFSAALGEILEWEFGAVNELVVRGDASNYLYTTHEVPFHWDGAFVGRIPRYIVFHCDSAPEAGGETLFADTTRLLARAARETRDEWAKLAVTYSTEKVVHYGGSFISPVLSRHPVTGEETVRFAEPVDDLNPVRLEIEGLPEGARERFLEDMRRRLRDPEVCYAHAWRSGDLVIADNHALLHGRRAFGVSAPRRIRRVNVL